MAGLVARGDGRRRGRRSPPASPSPTSAPTASRSPAAGPTGPSWTRLFGAVGESGRGVVGINGVNEELHFDEIYDLQRELGVPVTWTALLTMPTGTHLKALDHAPRRACSKGAEVWPAGVAAAR